MDFVTDLKHHLDQELSALDYTSKPKDDLEKVLLRFHNVQFRIPRRVSWDVQVSNEVSNELFNNTLRASDEQGLWQLIRDAEAGKDLKPYLSYTIEHPDFRDLMFYDWGVHHFHLGPARDPKRPSFVKRTDHLLCAITSSNDVVMYLIDIHPHSKAFANSDLVRVLEDNWPSALDPFTLKGIVATGGTLPSEQDVNEDRQAGLFRIIETPGGRLLRPMGGGLTTSRTGVENRQVADQDLRAIKDLQARVENDRPRLERQFAERYGLGWKDLDIRFTSFFPSITVTEKNTGTVLYCSASNDQ